MAARMFEPPTERYASPLDLAERLDPKHRTVPAIKAIDDALTEAWNTPDSRLIIQTPPQLGKSTHAVRRFALWALTQNPDARIVMASYGQRIAVRWSRQVRDDIRTHQDQLGNLRVRDDLAGQAEWRLAGYEGGVFATGIGGALTGRSADLLIIDDPVRDAEQASSATYQERNWEWWNATAQTRLSPGAPVILILTRWSTQDLAGKLMAEHPGEWKVLNLPAQADHNPDKGETDPLGREPGEWLTIPSGRTVAQWEQRKANTDQRTWSALYMGRPTPDEGGVFPRTDGWARYDKPWHTERNGANHVPGADERPEMELLTSWDLTFKDTSSSDYVVGQVWLRIRGMVYLLDQVRGQMNFGATERAIRDLRAKWPQSRQILIEDKANGPAIISHLRQEIPGIIPVEPHGSKYARAQAITPFVESGNVVLPETRLMPVQVNALMDEILAFPHGSHDDTVDAMTQAVKALLIDRIDRDQAGAIVEPAEYEDYTVSTWW
jgi:predicted phage terminase large subunit-like protein